MKEVIQALGNRVLESNVAVNRLAAIQERREENELLLRQKISEQNATLEEFRYEVRDKFIKIYERLGIISKDVDDTAKLQLLKANGKEKTAAAGTMEAFARLPRFTQILIVILVFLAAASGWLKDLF